MQDKVVFLAYPFAITEIRAAVESAASGLARVKCADSDLTDLQLLEKIKGQMLDANVCLFDMTTHNVNVAVEYGFAKGLGLAPIILYSTADSFRPPKEHDIFSDLRGVDSLRYSDFDALSKELRARLPQTLTSARKASVAMPRLQLELHSQTHPDGQSFFEGRIYNAGKISVDRVKLALAGYTLYRGQIARDPVRVGSLVPGQEFHPVKFRYDDLSYVKYPNGGEHVLVEYLDDDGQRYEQRGKFLARSQPNGEHSYTFEGLGPPKPIELFTLKIQGLEMP